jgi:hypothetical protein
LARGRDEIRLTYTSPAPGYISAAINYDPGWTATLNGARVQPLQANFNDLLVPVPAAGRGELVLRYQSVSGDVFFYSRYLLVILGVSGALALAWGTRLGAGAYSARGTTGLTNAGEARRPGSRRSALGALSARHSAAVRSAGATASGNDAE